MADTETRHGAPDAVRRWGKDAMRKKVMTKSRAAKQARAGKDMGKKGKNFSKIAAAAGEHYGSGEIGEKVAGAVFQKLRRSGRL